MADMNFDDLVDDNDPQSAVASQGLKQIGSAVAGNLSDQYQQGQARLKQAAGPVDSPDTREALLGLGEQSAMSTVGEGPHGNIITPNETHIAAIPVKINGRSVDAMSGRPLHASIKNLGNTVPDNQAIASALRGKIRDIDPAQMTVEPTIFKGRNGEDFHVLKLQGPEADYIGELHDTVNHLGPKDPYAKHSAHITVDKQTFDKAQQMIQNASEPVTAKSLGIEFGKPSLFKGPYKSPIKKYADGGMAQQPGVQTTSPDGQDFDSLQADQPQPGAPTNQDFDSLQDDSETYGTPGQQAIAGAEAVGQGLVGPLAPAAEVALGVDPANIRRRAEANEITHYVGEIAGLAAPALLTGGSSVAARVAGMTQAGLLSKIAFQGGETLAGRIGAAAAKGAIDNMLIAGSDEVSRAVLKDPGLSAQGAIAGIGLAGLLGGALGGGLGAISEGWARSHESKLGQIASDFQGRIQDHLTNPEPARAVQAELEGLYNGIKEVPVFGEKGIKAEALAKAMPEMSDEIGSQASDISGKIEHAVQDDLANDPNKGLLENELAKYNNAIESNDPHSIFSATQELKQQLQEWGKYNKDIVPLAERRFRDTAKSLAYDLRTALEDKNVWGKAGEIQQDINSAFSKFKPTLDDIEKTFTEKLANERVFSPGKVATYMKQLGKPNAEIKMQKVENYLKQADNYKAAIEKAYRTIGAESPFEPTPLNNVMNTLKDQTTGSKLADIVIQKGLTDAAGKTTGAGVGAFLGHMVGHGELGAIIGGHALGPFFSSVLPAVAGAVTKGEASGAGMKAATDFSVAVAKGIKAANIGAKAVFKAGSEVIPQALRPTADERSKLDTKLAEFQKNPSLLLNSQSRIDHYLPNHSQALAQTTAIAVNYLNSLRPAKDKNSPLDTEPVASSTQKAAFNAALDLANQPLMILEHIKKGTLTASDIATVSQIYPNLMDSLRTKLTSEMVDAIHNGETIPYKTKMSLSMFMGQPLDSTMSPLAIIAAQPMQPMPQGGPQGAPKGQGGTKSSPALQKMPGMYQTSSQARESRQQRNK